MTIMNPPDDAPGLGRRLARVPLFYKILGANAAIVVAGALIGTTISLQQGALHPGSPHYHLIALFAAPGILVSVTANLLLLRTVLKPLESLQDAFDAVQAGRQGVRVARSALSDERFDRLAGTFDHMIATLEQHAARLQHLPGQILRAQEEERQRIARELHDQAGQRLTSLLVGLRVLERAPTLEAVREGLSGLRELTLGALEDVRRVALDLRPPALDDLGLVSALQVHLDGIAAAGGLEVVLTTDGPDARLSPEAELALYRVAQEALTNALRHARASRVQVNLHVEATGILLEVADDGVGFDRNDARAPGLGLAGMRERMNLISGTLEVDSMPGRGTIVTARVGPGPQA